jgi:phosphate-selective porin
MLARLALALTAILLTESPALAQTGSSSSPLPIRVSGYVQGRETYQSGVGLTGTINRARLTAAGAVLGAVTWKIQGEFRTGNVGTGRASVSMQDAYIRWNRDSLAVQIGQFKTPFSREFVTSLAEIETADRATVVDSLAPKRDIGIMASYAIGGRATISAGIFNGEGQNVTANSDSSVLGVARVTFRPLPFLVLGANAGRYFADSIRYGMDAGIEATWITLRGEYLSQHRDALDADDDQGWYALAAAPVRPWLQPVFKYEWFDRPGIALGTQKNRAWTVGVNLFPWSRATRLTLEYVSRKVGEPGLRRSLGLAQAQVIF